MPKQSKKRGYEDIPSGQLKKQSSYASQATINDAYLDSNFMDSFSSAFIGKKSTIFKNQAKVVSEPFTCGLLPNFLLPDDYLYELKDEILQLEMDQKSSDLYQFNQSKDLGDSSSNVICRLKKLLYEDCLSWMRKITSMPLTDTVDISCSIYNYTDHLLCHDDKLEGRKIAFIFYLVPEWEENDGGILDLFTTENGQPAKVCTSFVPVWNNFLFFEVTPVSFHQVSEVLSNKTRISVSGWFHEPECKKSSVKELVVYRPPVFLDVDIRDWINPVYFDPETQIQIRENFEQDSEIELCDFLQENKYVEICKALLEEEIHWISQGPPTRRCYEEALTAGTLPSVLEECLNVLNSEALFLVLSNLTGVTLHEVSAQDSKNVFMGRCASSIRRWGHQCYTMLNDECYSESCLDATIYFNCSGWTAQCGGYTSYFAEDEDEELLRVEPKPNCLALVYINKGTARFTKYVNSICKKLSTPLFHDIFIMYVEDK